MDMSKLIDSLQCLLPSCNIVHTRAPSYVRAHSGADEEIILVTFKNKSQATPVCYAVSGHDEKESLELTGSPLKLDLSLRNILDDTAPLDETQHWKRDEISHLPTTLSVARSVCNEYIKLTRNIDRVDSVPLWAVVNASDENKTLLLSVRPHKNCFDRGAVTYRGEIAMEDISFEKLSNAEVNLDVECGVRVSGMSVHSLNTDDVLMAVHSGLTQLRCKWSAPTMEVPLHAKVTLEQEVIVGHTQSGCLPLWKSVCALNNINRALVDMSVAGYTAFHLKDIDIRPASSKPGPTMKDLSRRLQNLLNEVETYTYTARSLKGGCIFIPDDATTLKQCLDSLEVTGSSNDFTYKLWDVLKECENAEDLVTLLIHALKTISSGKIKPFITPSNKSYLAKLVLKLSRGHSQTGTVLQNLRTSPQRSLSLVAQLAVEDISQQFVHLFTPVDNSMCTANVLSQRRSNEAIEQINQTLHDMTMGSSDLTLNPFDNRSVTENSIRLNLDSVLEDDPSDMTVDNFASLKKHGLVGGEKRRDEAPLVLDEIDMSGWKNVLSRFAQLLVCLEHLNRAQQSLRLDFGSLSSILSGLQEHYLSDKSPVQTVSQLASEPVQTYSAPVNTPAIRDHLNNKKASFYRVHISRKCKRDGDTERAGQTETATTTHVFSQRAVFPPAIARVSEPECEVEVANATLSTGLKYHHYKYLHITTPMSTNFSLSKSI